MKKAILSLNIVPATACMLLMVQAYLVAPLTPTLTKDFNSGLISMAVPAFAIPFALAALSMVLLKPKVKLNLWLMISLGALCIGTYLLSKASSAHDFLWIRALTGLGTGVMLPTALLMAIRPQGKKRSMNHMVLIIFALASGMTFGPSLGGWLNDLIGWRGLYLGIAMLTALLLIISFLSDRQERGRGIVPYEMKAAGRSRSDWKSRYSYSFIFLTAVFHSGVFIWISYYFTTQYGLDEFYIATDLFIFGLPGFVVTLVMYFYQLNKQVIRVLYFSLGLTVAGLLLLMWNLPLWLAECLLGILSIGFGCSQPLFIGILKLPRGDVSPVGPIAKGSGLLFAGYGSGPLIMMALLSFNLKVAIVFLVVLVLALAYSSRRIWKV